MSEEDNIQIAILDYLRAVLPHGWIIKFVPNKPRSKIQGGREKRMGAIAGWPDLMILGTAYVGTLHPHEAPHAWFIEVKAAKGRVRDTQTDVHERLRGIGFKVGVARSIDDARALCKRWGLPLREAA